MDEAKQASTSVRLNEFMAPVGSSPEATDERNFADLINEMKRDEHQYVPSVTMTEEVDAESQELFGRADDGLVHQHTNNGANRSPLRGIKEHENEDASEVTPYRPSNVYITDEPELDKAHAYSFSRPMDTLNNQ